MIHTTQQRKSPASALLAALLATLLLNGCSGSDNNGGNTTPSTGDSTAPSIPTDISAIAVSSSQINISWSASTDPSVVGQTTSGVAGYRIYSNGTQLTTTTQTSYSSTGLSENTTYVYTVSAYDATGNVSAQSVSVSVTKPGPPQPADSFTFTTTGDIGGGTAMRNGIPITTVTLQNMAAQKAAFFLVLGDLSYSQVTPESAWCEYMQSIFGMTHPIMLETGNHENNGSNGLIENFAKCLPALLPITGTYGREYYFDYPTSSPLARFIMLPAGLGKNYNNGSSDQAWLNTLIDQTRTAGIKWVIVGMHTVCPTIGEKNCQPYQASAGPDLFNFLVNKKVDLVLQAHEHNYQRSKQLSLGPFCTAIPVQSDATPNAIANLNCIVDSDDSLAKGAGTVIVISGITPNYLWPYSINWNDPEAPYFKVAQDSNYGYTKVTISATQLTSQFIRTGETWGNPPVFSDNFTITE